MKRFAVIGVLGLLLAGAGCLDQDAQGPDLGFTMEETESSGTWNVVTSGNGYRGSFEHDGTLTYLAIEPNTATTGRGATWSDVVGYRETEDGQFEFTFNGEDWNLIDEEYIGVIGETPLKNGEALVLAPIDCDPSPACYGGPGLMAIVNTPNGVTPGGVFHAGDTTIVPAFKAALERVSIN